MIIPKTRMERAMNADPREKKLPVWTQDSLRDLRRMLAHVIDENETLRGTRPTAGSDLLLDVMDLDDGTERLAGLGHRAKVICPIGDRRRAVDDRPIDYIEFAAERDADGNVVGAAIRGSSRLLITPEVTNSVTAFVRKL